MVKMIDLSLFKRKSDTQPELVERAWTALCAKFAEPAIRAAKDGLLFSPTVFEGTRNNENAREFSAIVLDLDDDVPTVAQTCESALRLGCAFSVHSTHSHLRITDSNPTGGRRLRLFVPLKSPVPAAKYKTLRKRVIKTTGLVVDPATSALDQMYYTPVKASAGAPYEYHIEEGEFLDWTTLDLSEAPEKSPPAVNFAPAEGSTLTVDELIRKALTAKNGSETFRLFDGDTSLFGGDDSRADQSLASRFVFFARDAATLEEMLRRSRLARKKWDEVHYGDGRTYLQGLIEKAFSSHTGEFYSGNGHRNFTAPDDLLAEAEEQAFPAIDRAAYFGLAGDIVRTVAPHSEADPIALLVQTIVAFGNCVGRAPYFPVEGDEHHLNLSVVLVGDSSKSRKGTSWGQVRRPFRAVDEDWMNDCVQTGLSSGEGLIWGVRDPIEKEEPVKEKGRVTEYQTVIVDHGVDDKRLLVQEPEFAKVLRVMAREGNTLSPVIRQAWDNGDLRILTKTSPARATDAHISIIGHITGEELRRNLDETESANGFANRILWVQVRRSKFLPEGGSLRDSDLNSLVSRLSKAIQHARSLTRLERDEEARQMWCEVYSDLSAGHSGLFGAITSRAEAQVLRLSCIYALLDHSDVIKRPHLEAALALWKYCEDSARFVFGQATGDRTADAIADALAEAGDQGLTKTQLSDVFSRKKDAAEINRALALLQQRGLVASRREQTEGRSRQRYFLTTPVAKKAKEAKKGAGG